LYLMMTWMLAEVSIGWPYRRLALNGLAGASIAGLAYLAYGQTSHWKTSESLWSHTLAVTVRNGLAYYNLGQEMLQNGRVDEAIVAFQQALAIEPNFAKAHNNLGDALLQKGQVDEAIDHLRQALATQPDNAEAHNNLGNALFQKGRVDEAALHYQRALAIRPGFAQANYNLGNYFLQKGSVDEAIVQFQKALAGKPDFIDACNNLGAALLRKGRLDEAIVPFQQALAIQPGLGEAQSGLANIAWALATSPNPAVRNGTKAVELAQQIDRFSGGGNPIVVATLAAAYAEAGRFPEAITIARRAAQLAAGQNDPAMAAAIEAQLKTYQAGSPFRETGRSR
jgi:tetratricopeptide (TPR) repeat protein